MKLDAGTCRFCGQAIFWVVLPSEKKAPLDPALLYVIPEEDAVEAQGQGEPHLEDGAQQPSPARLTLIHANTGQVVRGLQAPGPGGVAQPGRTNHWGTCPQRARAKAELQAKQPPWREQLQGWRVQPCPHCEAQGQHEARCTPWVQHWGEVRCFECQRHIRWLPKPPDNDRGAWSLYQRALEQHQLHKRRPRALDDQAREAQTHEAGGPT